MIMKNLIILGTLFFATTSSWVCGNCEQMEDEGTSYCTWCGSERE